MSISSNHRAVIESLNLSWPPAMQLDLTDSGLEIREDHPLAGELVALLENRTCSLPLFVPGQPIAWFTVAPTSEDIRSAIDQVRAWLIPSFAWEDPRGWLVTPLQVQGEMGHRLVQLSPAGYCRWRCERSDLDVVLKKLRLSRYVDSVRPHHEFTLHPSLFEARERFVMSLLAGERGAAEAAIDVIDSRQLDAADNTLFMRYRCWSYFRDWQAILASPHLDHFIQITSPKRVRLGVLEAFHAVFLAPFEAAGNIAGAIRQFHEHLAFRLSDMIARCEPTDGVVAQRLLAYLALSRQGSEAPASLPACTDPMAMAILAEMPQTPTPVVVPIESRWDEARRKGDWSLIQSIGLELLLVHPEYETVLRHSLEILPNPILSQRLTELGSLQEPTIPQSWVEWFRRLIDGFPPETLQFIESRCPLDLDHLPANEAEVLQEAIEELYLDSRVASGPVLRQELLIGLPEFIFEVVRDSQFPRARLASVYLNMFRLWSVIKRGSVSLSDGTFLLNLAEGVLRHRGDAENEIAQELLNWWQSRPVKALLPFVLDAVELLDELGAETQRENLWLSAAEYVRRNYTALLPSERILWRSIGTKIGFDDSLLDEYVPLPPAVSPSDPIADAQLRKIAIVSLRERQAQEAAVLLRRRCESEILVVTSTVAGSQTDAACSADVILFVWGATSHAVYRAFDSYDRSRIAYVSGTGAASIVRTLERWVDTRTDV